MVDHSNRSAGGATHPGGHPHRESQGFVPRLIAWETTRACPLACKHCRAAAQPTADADELSTDEGRRLLEGIAAFARPTIILTGGEPMLRSDIYDLAAYARELGLRAVMAPCGMLLSDQTAARLVAAGIEHISISIDGADAAAHDAFRGVPGAFDGALRGIEAAKRAGLGFQINTTVTQHNVAHLEAILDLAVRLGASAFNPFLLVPTGRGRLLADQEISAAEYETTLTWLATQQDRRDIHIRVTCAPHYQRILRQSGRAAASARAPKGCMGGKAFAFVSSRGKVQICGFLDVECGDLRRERFDFRKVWETSEVFLQMRRPDEYRGRCGYCEFRHVCGGCRARAFALSGDYLGEEPFCVYEPTRRRPASDRGPGQGGEVSDRQGESPTAALDPLDRRIVSAVQAALPVVARPFAALAADLGADPADVLQRLAAMKASGLVRRIGPVFDSRRLGYVSTLVAARVPPGQLEDVAARVTALPGVTHNYERNHQWNLWFTLTARSGDELRSILADLRRDSGISDFHGLPALAVYKIRAVFDLDASAPPPTAAAPAPGRGRPAELDESQRRLVRLLQDDLPLVDEPFAPVAGRLGWSVDEVVGQVRTWLAEGVIRRFGAIVRHHRLGFIANGMAVFAVAPDRIDEAGRRLAACPEISHCYRRPALEGWPYELFAMVHGSSEDAVRRQVAALAAEVRATESDVLFSVREFKKTSAQYFLDEDEED